MKKILLVSSSSGGHVYPCFVLGENLKKRSYNVTYLGIKGQYEASVIESITLLDIPNSFKKSLKKTEIKKVLKSKKEIQAIIKEHDLIIAFGGYISFLVGMFNLKIRKPLYLHEQNVILGDSIKILYPFCKKVFLSFDNDLVRLKKACYTSNPTIVNINSRLDVDIKNPKVLFVFGSLSSNTCLKVVHDFLKSTNLKNQFLVVTGKNKKMFDDINKSNVIIKDRINMAEELKIYDLVFSRSGATSLLELIKSRVEIVLIPSPYVKNNHQYKNALFYYKKGKVDLIEEKNLSSREIESKIINLKRKNDMCIDINPIDLIIDEVDNESV